MTSRVFRITAVSLALLAATPVLAQDATDDTAVVTTTDDDDGFDLGWLGLLGLAGLAGLRGRKRDDTIRTTTTTR
jgi:MYXO-CTERM domain-containing protein